MDVALTNMKPLLPGVERIAVAGSEDTWDYPYFGRDLEREVLRVDPRSVTRATFEEQNVPLIVWADNGEPPPLAGVRARQVSCAIWALTKR